MGSGFDDNRYYDTESSDGYIIFGSVERVIFQNEENGYTICSFSTDDGDIITIVGTMPYVVEGMRLSIDGIWVHNPKYGRQFKVESYEKQIPVDTESILRYLASGAIKGIGAKRAIKIVEEFGEDTFDIIENHPDWLAQIPGISRKAAAEISENFKAESKMRTTMMFFREYFGPALTVRIYKTLGSSAVDMVKENPYILCERVEGIGFEKADSIAESFSFDQASEARLMSGLLYILTSSGAQNGHSCLPKDKLIEAGTKMLSVSAEAAENALRLLLQIGKAKYSVFDSVQYIYERSAYEAEAYVAGKLHSLDSLCSKIDYEDIERFISREETQCSISYAPQQKAAIRSALDGGVMILTGGPGTGKTTVVRALLAIFQSMSMKVALSAPTGRAAKRMSEATSFEAKTVHRLLEMEYGEGETAVFLRNEHNYLDENVIIVDEASMIDIRLACALLKAVKPGARVIFIGDADQLPSVGAGNFLRDIIDSEHFSTIRLNAIFRQSRESLIVTNSHAINEGRMPEINVKDNDFFFLYRENEREISKTIADLYKSRLPKSYGIEIINRIQVISPSRKGEAGTENLNNILQMTLNPPNKNADEYKFRETVFRQGDRVMQTRNNYELEWSTQSRDGVGIFNGDIGIIREIDKSEQYMLIDFDDKSVMYDFSLLDDLEHSYAITVHKSQGCEYPIVIIPVYSCPPILMTRNLLYTAVTRAQSMVILVGREEHIRKMIENNRQTMRYTGLSKRLFDEERVKE